MKKILLFALAFATTGVYAQTEQTGFTSDTFKNSLCVMENCTCNMKIPAQDYINISHSTQKMKLVGSSETIKSCEGAALEFGHTYFIMPRKPLTVKGLGDIRFGVDFSYLDLQFNRFDENDQEAYFGNIGVQFGPSVTFTPIKDVNVRLYGHYAPSLAALVMDDSEGEIDEVMFGYAGYLTGGLHASWKFLTLGVELRGTKSKLTTVSENDIEVEEIDPGTITSIDDVYDLNPEWKISTDRKVKVKLPGVRFTLGFRF